MPNKVVDESGSVLISLRLPVKLIETLDKMAKIKAREEGKGRGPNRSGVCRAYLTKGVKEDVALMKKRRAAGPKKSRVARNAKATGKPKRKRSK